MFGDVCYFFLVTPMVAVSVWMFICGAVHYYNSPTSGPDDWKTILPLSMSVVALVAYVTYFVIFLVRSQRSPSQKNIEYHITSHHITYTY